MYLVDKLYNMRMKNPEGYIGYLIGSAFIVLLGLLNKGLNFSNPEAE
jgi:hypothetical protein